MTIGWDQNRRQAGTAGGHGQWRRKPLTKRSKDLPHIRLYRGDMETAAWRSLSFGARCLYIELKKLYNGSNNGKLYLSAREAAERMPTNRMSANRWFHELEDRGFIMPAQKSSFDWKSGAGEGVATTW